MRRALGRAASTAPGRLPAPGPPRASASGLRVRAGERGRAAMRGGAILQVSCRCRGAELPAFPRSTRCATAAAASRQQGAAPAQRGKRRQCPYALRPHCVAAAVCTRIGRPHGRPRAGPGARRIRIFGRPVHGAAICTWPFESPYARSIVRSELAVEIKMPVTHFCSLFPGKECYYVLHDL
jgi:hypothetical protein